MKKRWIKSQFSFWSYIEWRWTEGLERRMNMKERRFFFVYYFFHCCFVANLCDPSAPCDLFSTLPEWPNHATPKGSRNCIVPPLFSFFLGNKRRYMSSILPREWANKTTACSYMYRSPSPPKNIFHMRPLRGGHVACFPGHFLWSCCFIVLTDPISLPLWCDFSFCCPGQSHSYGSPGKEK